MTGLSRRGFLGWAAVGTAGLLLPELVKPAAKVFDMGRGLARRGRVRLASVRLDGRPLSLDRCHVSFDRDDLLQVTYDHSGRSLGVVIASLAMSPLAEYRDIELDIRGMTSGPYTGILWTVASIRA